MSGPVVPDRKYTNECALVLHVVEPRNVRRIWIKSHPDSNKYVILVISGVEYTVYRQQLSSTTAMVDICAGG